MQLGLRRFVVVVVVSPAVAKEGRGAVKGPFAEADEGRGGVVEGGGGGGHAAGEDGGGELAGGPEGGGLEVEGLVGATGAEGDDEAHDGGDAGAGEPGIWLAGSRTCVRTQ